MLCQSIKNAGTKKEIIVVHNLKDVIDEVTLNKIWHNQITKIYPGRTIIEKITLENSEKQKIEVFISEYKTIHLYLYNNNCIIGKNFNKFVFKKIKDLIINKYTSVETNNSPVKKLIDNMSIKLKNLFNKFDKEMVVKISKSYTNNIGTEKENLVFCYPEDDINRKDL